MKLKKTTPHLKIFCVLCCRSKITGGGMLAQLRSEPAWVLRVCVCGIWHFIKSYDVAFLKLSLDK